MRKCEELLLYASPDDKVYLRAIAEIMTAQAPGPVNNACTLTAGRLLLSSAMLGKALRTLKSAAPEIYEDILAEYRAFVHPSAIYDMMDESDQPLSAPLPDQSVN